MLVRSAENEVSNRNRKKKERNGNKRRSEGTPSLRRVVASRLHLLRIVVCAVWTWRHHATHAGNSVARLRVPFHRRWWRRRLVELSRVDVEGHTIGLVGHHICLTSCGRRSGDSRSSHRHDVSRLLCARYEHRHHTSRCHVLRLGTSRRVVVVLRNESRGLEAGLLIGLESGRMDRSLWDVGERSASGYLAWVRRLAAVLVEGLRIGCGRSAVHVRRDLLVERLLLLLLWWVEGHGSRRLDASDRHSLLGTGLVHCELALPVLAISWLLGQRVCVRPGHARGGHPGW